MSPNQSFWTNLLSSFKLKLQEWIRQEIVDDDPWDAEPASSEAEQSDSETSLNPSEAKLVERSSESVSD